MERMQSIRGWCVVALTAVLVACGGGSSDGEVTLVPSTAQLGAAGGAVTAADGASVYVPDGAFATDATISITRDGSGAPALPDVAQPASAVYRITPHGGDFQRFVTVSIPVTASQVPDGAQLVLLTADPGESGWRMLSAATYVDGVMRAPVMKFSYFQVASLPNVRLPVLQTQIFRVSNAGFPGTQQVPADYEIAGQWGSFGSSRDPDDIQDRIDAEARLRYEPVILRLRTASVAPRACLPSDYGPAGLRWSSLRDGVAASVATSHRLPWVAFNLSAQRPWPRTWNEAFVTTSGRDPAQTPPFASELLSSQRYPAAGFGTLHFYGQDSPRTGALIETSPGYIAVMPPAGNVPEDDHLSWYATVHLRPGDNGRWRFDAVVATDCGIAVQAAPLSVRVNLRDTGIAAWRGGLNPNPTQNDDLDLLWRDNNRRIVDTGVTRRAVLGLPTTMQFTVTPSTWDSIYDSLADSNPLRWTAFQELRSISWEYSVDGNTWVARPDLAAKATPFPVVVPGDPVPGDPFLTLPATTLPYLSHYDLRIDEVVPQSAGYYRAFVCSRWLTKGKREPMSALRETASGCGAFGRFQLEVVSTPPSVTRQPAGQTVMVGETATLVVAADGLPAPAVQWEKRSFGDAFLNLPWTPVVGATAPSYTTPALTLADHPTYYRAVLSSAAGRAVSDVATVGVVQQLAAPVVSGQPGSLNVTVGGTAVFAATVTGAAPLAYQWRRNGVDITGANSPILTLSNVTAINDGQYTLAVSNRAGSVVSEPAALVVTLGTPVALPPTLANQPGSLSVPAGSAANFAVGVSGSGPFSYAWYRDGQASPVSNAPSLAFASVGSGDAGSYTVRITNTVGTVVSAAATLSVGAAATVAPRIVTPPSNIVAVPGASARFVVAASGSAPLSYQWRFNGNDIAGATGPLLDVPAAGGGDVGAYTVEVRNGSGAVLSSAAQLVLIGAPAINTQPAAASATVGGTASFSVMASGDLLRYQWMRNGIGIVGATSASYTTPALALADNGAVYSVIVYNGAGLVTSGGAVLTVAPAPNPPGMVLFAGDFSSAGTTTGTGTTARFDNPQGLTADASGNLYVASSNGQFVSKIDPGAAVTHLFFAPALTSTSFYANPALGPDGSMFVGSYSWCGLWRAAPPLTAPTPVTEITLANCPVFVSNGLSVDSQGRVAIADTSRHAIIRATQQPGGSWTQGYFAGATDYFGGDANRGSTDATGTAARFSAPTGLAFAANGDLFVADQDNGTIRRITPAGEVSTFAGAAGQQSTLDGTGTAARFDRPYGLAFDPDGNLVVLQLGASSAEPAWVRRITPAGLVTTLFDARAEAAALATDGNAVANARNVRGIAAPGSKRIALSAGNAVLVRTLP